MSNKKLKDLTPEDIIGIKLPKKMPSMSRQEIRIARDKITASKTKKLHELATQKMAKIEELSKKHMINMDMMRSPETLAKEIMKLEEAINRGDRTSIGIKKKVIEAKTEIEKVLKEFDKKRQKVVDHYKDEREKINVIDRDWSQIRLAQREHEADKLRATSHEVDELVSKVRGLELQIKGYRLDRHLVAQVENIKSENEVIKNQLQKVFQLLKNAGIGNR